MAIKRFYATADTTITDAYSEDLSNRASNSNMGRADTLEVFSIYDQVETVENTTDGRATILPHRELARILLKFDTAAIIADTDVPSTAHFFLRLSNAVHPHTLPSGFTLDVWALDEVWEEGYGMDADEYSFSGSIGQSAAASWTARRYDVPPLSTPATGAFEVDVNPTTAITVRVGGHSIIVTPDGAGAAATAIAIAAGINTANSPIASLVTATTGGGLPNGRVRITADNIGGNNIPISVSTTTGRILRNSPNWTAIGSGGSNGPGRLSGGVDTLAWTTAGGDFGSATRSTSPIGSQTFEEGDEDILIDISSFITGVRGGAPYTDLGLLIKLSSNDEAALRSFYTKKFFARSSEYFFFRPVIEARWDSSTQDDRGNLFASHPMRTDNANNLLLKNYEGGALTNAATPPNRMAIWEDSTKNNLIQVETVIAVAGTIGTYTSQNFSLDTQLDSVYVEWYNSASPVVFHSENLKVKRRPPTTSNTTQEYVISMPSMKSNYLGKDPDENTVAEIARFRLYARLKDWNPTIYSKATKEIDTEIIEQAYYKIIRLADEFTVIDYGIGGDEQTKLSYDVDGNFFELDMALLEKGYAYGIKYMFVINGERREQPEVFKFRVE